MKKNTKDTTLLFIDNEQLVLDMLSEYFDNSSWGDCFYFGIIEAKHYIASMSLEDMQKTILITDYHMPHDNGIALCKKYLNFKAKIIYTSDADNTDISDVLQQGVIDGFVSKDGDVDSMSKLEAILQQLI